ncbi:MAG: AAA family ATPase [Chloroflexi bacterium]|nr:AAA family ATPase [Chloroflexota bacterium]
MEDEDLRSPVALVDPLTKREVDILRLLAGDLSLNAIASQLVLAPETVKWYAKQLYSKLGIIESGQKRRQAVARARALGLLEVERTPAGRPRYSLPVQTTPFIGRTGEIEAIVALLSNPNVRLVTLLGPGGMGKTRLALEIGWRLVEPEAFGLQGSPFSDGVYFVPLQPVETPEAILWAIAEAVGFTFQSGSRAPHQQLQDFFREKRLLLILDNFEHLLDGANHITDLLGAAPGVQALVTSRQTLNLNAETVYPLGGLPIADQLDYDAARLFTFAARRARADFALHDADHSALARICRMVEGMPLALLLAAAWVEVLSLPEIADEIAASLDFLTAEMRDAPRRQWSIRAVFEPTWQRLSEAERSAFARLSVFRGGCARQAAQAVTGVRLPVLQALVNKSVLTRTPGGRYDMHGLLRQYAVERLATANETDLAHDAHADYFASFVADREADLKGGDRQLVALDEIAADFENVCAAWERSVERRNTEALKRMEGALAQFINMRNRCAQGLVLYHNVLGLDDDPALHVQVMTTFAARCIEVARWQEADEWSDMSLAVARELNIPEILAPSLRVRAIVLADLYRDFPQSHRLVDESLQIWQTLSDAWGIAIGWQTKGYIAGLEGDFASAVRFSEAALAQATLTGNRHRIAASRLNAGSYHLALGHSEPALEHTRTSLAYFRELSAPAGIAMAVSNLAEIAIHGGDYETALRHLEEAWLLASEVGIPPVIFEDNATIANILSLTGRPAEAAARLSDCRRLLVTVESGQMDTELRFHTAQIAFRQGDYDETIRCAEAVVARSQDGNYLTWEKLCRALLGLVEIKRGQFDAAHRQLIASLPVSGENPALMRAIYGLAALEAATGSPERAVELSALVDHHRVAEFEYKIYAQDLLTELRTSLPPEVYAAAVERGEALDPKAVAAAYLQGNSA